ncbi:MAG: alanine dehydrogenase [Deltaproteobacteria bacterium]|nr:alanine dehydrogenase [Deltaproteobacteria bacterium]
MKIGVAREIKDNENRVALTAEGAKQLVAAGNVVHVERSAGAGCGISDAEYIEAGATMVDAREAWNSDLVIKVKEPVPAEFDYLGGQIVFTYFHLAGVDVGLTEALLESGTTAIAYETVEDERGRLPLLAPMSAVAGSMAPVMGSYYLAGFAGGRGMLIGDILGNRYGKVVVIGDGVVGQHAARVAGAMGGRVVLFGLHPDRAESLAHLAPDLEYVFSNEENIASHLPDTDLLVGGVLVEGARAPHVVSAERVGTMPEGSVIVDVSIDQGGCVETSRPTSHSNPVYVERGVTHYCVTNMPGAYPRTSTFALTAATLPYAKRLAEGGVEAAFEDAPFAQGVNTHQGKITFRPVAVALGMLDRYAELERR